MAMSAAIVTGNDQRGDFAWYGVGVALAAAAGAAIAAVVSRTGSFVFAIAAIAPLVVVLFAVWLFLASWTVSTGFGSSPDCSQVGFAGPSQYDRAILPTGLWCVSPDGDERTLVTPDDRVIGSTVAGSLLLSASVGIAIGGIAAAARATRQSG